LTTLANLTTAWASPVFASLVALQAWTPTNVGQHATVSGDGTGGNNRDYWWTGSAWDPHDTGWQALVSTGSQITLNGASVRVKDGILYFLGAPSKSSDYVTGDTIGRIPTAIANTITRNVYVSGWFGDGTGVVLTATTTGTLVLGGVSGTASETLYLGNGGPVN